MTASELRSKFIDFFISKGHKVLPNVSLVPKNDPTTLFIVGGVQPIEPYLTGKKHPLGKRLCNVQRCVRTIDIEEIGDSVHHSFFEMLGNWSLGDYFKNESIEWSYEFLTKVLKFDPNRLWVTVFKGDKDAPYDGESKNIWLELGIPEEKIIALGKRDNWWGPAGIAGPCGPDTEVFFDRQPEYGLDGPKPGGESERFSEVWNNVFSEFYKDDEGRFRELKQKNVDTGLGLERTLATVNGYSDNYQTELFLPIIEKIEKLSDKSYPRETLESSKKTLNPTVPPFSTSEVDNAFVKAFRVISDHSRAATFILADGVYPSNTERGYVLRRLIRSAIRHGRTLGLKENFLTDLAGVVIKNYSEPYPHLKDKSNEILESISDEEEQFGSMLDRGIREFNKITQSKDKISGKQAFDLYQSYGFPIEMTVEMAGYKSINVDEKGYKREYKKHQELSRTASKGRFAGGLADHSEETTKLHTATHLLHQALREVLGDHIKQMGSNITKDRLRLDFSHPQKLTDGEIKKVENLVNEKINGDLKVHFETKNIETAQKEGALAFFGEKYSDKVNVYYIGDFSKEVCGGPHVKSTGELGKFKIVKEKSVGKGVRRIRAVLE